MRINELAERALEISTRKGFHDTERRLREALTGDAELLREEESLQTARRLVLIQSEISEAVEACRKDRYADMNAFANSAKTKEDFEKYVKDSFEDELADAVIRILELAAIKKIDLESHILAKMAYNEQRPHKFGKAY